VANPDANIWRVPISAGVVEKSASPITFPAVRGLSPRIGPNYMLYLSSKGGDDGIWKLANGAAVELWSGSLGRVLVGPAIAPDGRRIAFTAQKGGRSKIYLMNSDGTGVRGTRVGRDGALQQRNRTIERRVTPGPSAVEVAMTKRDFSKAVAMPRGPVLKFAPQRSRCSLSLSPPTLENLPPEAQSLP
jgi:hypothetical protein